MSLCLRSILPQLHLEVTRFFARCGELVVSLSHANNHHMKPLGKTVFAFSLPLPSLKLESGDAWTRFHEEESSVCCDAQQVGAAAPRVGG